MSASMSRDGIDQVIRVPERHDVPAVAAGEAQPADDVVELGEVQGEVEDIMLELVHARARPAMADLAFEEVGPHAARSASPASASAR